MHTLSKHFPPINKYEEDMYLLEKAFAELNGYHEWEQSLPAYTLFQALEIWPEATPIVRKKLKAEMKEAKKNLEGFELRFEAGKREIEETERSFLIAISLKVELSKQLADERVALENKIKRIAFNLARLDGKTPKGEVGDTDIRKAKEVPISELLQINRMGKTKCLWHEEKTASLHYYRNSNRLYCFSCSKAADSIDVIMAQRNCDFISAVKWLCKI